MLHCPPCPQVQLEGHVRAQVRPASVALSPQANPCAVPVRGRQVQALGGAQALHTARLQGGLLRAPARLAGLLPLRRATPPSSRTAQRPPSPRRHCKSVRHAPPPVEFVSEFVTGLQQRRRGGGRLRGALPVPPRPAPPDPARAAVVNVHRAIGFIMRSRGSAAPRLALRGGAGARG